MKYKWELIRDCLGDKKMTSKQIAVAIDEPLTCTKTALTSYKKKGVFGYKDPYWYFIKDNEPSYKKNDYVVSRLRDRRYIYPYTYNRLKEIIDVVKKAGVPMTKKEITDKCCLFVNIRHELSILCSGGLFLIEMKTYNEKAYRINPEPKTMKVMVMDKEMELTNE